MDLNNEIYLDEVLAFYLPQYHEIPENNKWWGNGFTEWTNVKSAKLIFSDQEIHRPNSCLGFYNLNDVNVIAKQYEIAKQHSISTFCFWHYWFDSDDVLLDNPAKLILNSNIDVKFCFAWANHSWWNKTEGILLKEQKYDFCIEHYFEFLLPYFKDNRYSKIDNKPIFTIYDPLMCENLNELIKVFNFKAIQAGFNGIYFIAEKTNSNSDHKHLFESYLNSPSIWGAKSKSQRLKEKIFKVSSRFGLKFPQKYSYIDLVSNSNSDISHDEKQIPVVFPGWDSTIRHGKGGIYLSGSNPVTFEKHLYDLSCKMKIKPHSKILFVKSWNEWAEGNFMEPSEKHGFKYLEVFNKYFKINKGI
jgi:hypothetical protein